MTVKSEPMQRLYEKLQTLGYGKRYVHSLLPDWWDDAIADTPAGFQQASLMLGRLFSVMYGIVKPGEGVCEKVGVFEGGDRRIRHGH